MNQTRDHVWSARAETRAWCALVLVGVIALCLADIFPGLDIGASALFYSPGEGFPLADLGIFVLAMKMLPILAIGIAVIAAVAGFAAMASDRAWYGVSPRTALYIVLSLVLGPGLIVNTLFKDNWGRARPHQIIEFGGTAHFTPVLTIAHECAHNCSFPSGHGALGFWTIALAALAPGRWRVPAAAVALTIGAMVGLMRIAQGGHFLTDVLGAAILVLGLNFALKYLILGPDDWRG